MAKRGLANPAWRIEKVSYADAVSLLLFHVDIILLAIGDPLISKADTPASGEIEYMTSRHARVEGVITQLKSGLYTVKTATGTNYTLAEAVPVRDGRDMPRVGDEMILWSDEDNHVMDARRIGGHRLSPQYMSGTLLSINYATSQITLAISDNDENNFKLRKKNHMFRTLPSVYPSPSR